MSKKHYVLIARAFASHVSLCKLQNDPAGEEAIRLLAKDLAGDLVCDNPRFDYDRFVNAATKGE